MFRILRLRPSRRAAVEQDEQRSLGVQIAQRRNAGKSADAIKNREKCFEDILKTALAENGLEVFVAGVLEGPPQWAAETLRHIDHVGLHRDALVRKAAEDPEAAHYVLYHGVDAGDHRSALLAATAGDPVWAHMTLREVADLGDQREALLAAVATDPRSARFTLEQVPDLGSHREAIAAAAAQSTS